MAAVEIDPSNLDDRHLYFLLSGLVVPRPIAWVSTLGQDGTPNLAPHSYYNAVSSAPPIVMFSSTHAPRREPDGIKDTLRNIRGTGEFVVNVVDAELLAPMNATAADCPPGVDEFRVAAVEHAPSRKVSPPRVASAKAAMECRLRQLMEMGDATIIFGDVVHFHIDASICVDGRVDIERLMPVGRLSGSGYAVIDRVKIIPRALWTST
jgi:flavin reductase (DIM6/NTAB) family NADH-FMN oxidoreductase RutF